VDLLYLFVYDHQSNLRRLFAIQLLVPEEICQGQKSAIIVKFYLPFTIAEGNELGKGKFGGLVVAFLKLVKILQLRIIKAHDMMTSLLQFLADNIRALLKRQSLLHKFEPIVIVDHGNKTIDQHFLF
jgi:hypothetical protein